MAAQSEYKPEDILRIEIVTRVLLDDALGRYIHHPDNWGNIRRVLQVGMKSLRDGGGSSPGPKCPSGYEERDYAFVPVELPQEAEESETHAIDDSRLL
jgi:hypothetical protein